jgi:hypothetical protein
MGDDSLIYFWAMKHEKVAYGFQVYDVVIESMEGFFNGSCTIDYVTVHLLAEHKKVIARRLKYIIDLYQLKGRIVEAYNEFLKLSEIFNEIRLKAFELEYSFKNNTMDKTETELGAILSEIIGILKSSRDKEKILLSEIYRLLNERF